MVGERGEAMAEPASDQPTDEQLIAIAREAGPAAKAAFGELVRRHQAWLVRLLQYLLGGRADADDVAQDVLVRAFEGLHAFRGEASFRGWLRVIATRQAYNHGRDRGRHHSKVRGARAEIEPFVRNGSGPVMARDAIGKVLEAIAYPFREILILRHVEELSVQQIAQMLDLGESAAKMRLSRARSSFWEAYEQMVNHD
jgi:RNA polymerase sigma-70 factor (ECF subfamily)